MFSNLIEECRSEILNEGVASEVAWHAKAPIRKVKDTLRKRQVAQANAGDGKNRAHQKIRRRLGMSQADIDEISPGKKKWYQRKIKAKS